MNNILGQFGLGGRLAENIRERQGMAYYAFSSFDPSLGPGPLVIRAGVNPANVERAVAAIDAEVGALGRDGATERELLETRQYLIGSIPRMLETNQSIATFLQTAEFFGLGLDYDRRLPALLRAVTLEDVNAAAASVLDPARASIATAGPASARDAVRRASAWRAVTKAVFFDVDFTLIHPGPTFQGHGYAEACARHGVPPTRRGSTPRWRRPPRRSTRRAARTIPRSSSTTPGASSRGWAAAAPASMPRPAISTTQWSACHHFTLYEEVPEVLRALHADGFTIGLISNTQRSLKTFEEHFELDGLFKVAISSSDHGYMKPHPSIFEEGLRQAGVTAGDAVMVGDSVPHDIEGALRLGMRGILVAALGAVDRRARRRAGHPVAARAEEPALIIRELTTIEDCRLVADLEKQVWGYTDNEDVVPPPVLIVSAKRGGILLGAFDEAGVMKGFVYSIPALKDGVLTQWSHMLGVTPDARDSGLGLTLKLAQRERSLAMGIELIEWTYDPLQALNAHLNFTKLGVVVEEYEENIYGVSSSPLHSGSPTDRFVAEWRLNAPHVVRRIEAKGLGIVRDASVASAPLVNPSRRVGTLAGSGRRLSRARRAAAAGRNPGRRRRVATRRSVARAGVAPRDARHLPALLRAPLPRRRLLPVPRRGAGTLPAQPTAQVTRSRAALFLVPAFLALSAWPLFHLLGQAAVAVPGGGAGDNLTFLWNSWWMYRAVHGGGSFFFSPMLFAPFGVDLTLHTHTALPSLVAAAFASPDSLVLRTNLVIALHLFLNFGCAFALGWKVTRDLPAAVLGSVVFGWSPYVGSHLAGHFNLIAAWILPLTVYLLMTSLEDRSRIARVSLGILAGVAPYIDYYYAIYAFVLVIVFVVQRSLTLSMPPGVARPNWQRGLAARRGRSLARGAGRGDGNRDHRRWRDPRRVSRGVDVEYRQSDLHSWCAHAGMGRGRSRASQCVPSRIGPPSARTWAGWRCRWRSARSWWRLC